MDEHNKKDNEQQWRSTEQYGASDSNNETNQYNNDNAEQTKEQSTSSSTYYYAYGSTLNNRPQQPEQVGQRASIYDEAVKTVDAEINPATPPPAIGQTTGSGTRAFTSSNNNGNWRVAPPPKRRAFRSYFIAFLAGALVVGGLMYTADVRNWFTGGSQAVVQEKVNPPATGSSNNGQSSVTGGNNATVSSNFKLPNNITELFNQSSPAVVKIETFEQRQAQRRGTSLFDDPFFRQFFGDNFAMPEEQESGGRVQTGIGTGFFFEADGYILTNQHVVGDASEIQVTIQGYEEPLQAKLLGSSYELDLAVIKVENANDKFPTLPLGSSDDIGIGDWVVAIGNPYGFDHTTTVGVISAKERPIDIADRQGDRHYKHLLQTDASINPGNSGGPLLNLAGEVVGINTAVSAQAQGIGFAIPTSTVQNVLADLKVGNEIAKEPQPFVGIQGETVNEKIAEQFGLKKAEGSIIVNIVYNTPAYKAGLKQYDVITAINGTVYKTYPELQAAIKELTVGEVVELSIIRQGVEEIISLEIGDLNQM